MQFHEIAAQAGVDWIYHNGAEADLCTMVETLGGGVALCDYDGDGLLDVCFTGGGTVATDLSTRGLPSGLFRNLGEHQFRESTAAAAMDAPRYYSHGISAADYDADGFPDLLVTGYGGLVLWHNQGDGTFVERQVEAELSDSQWSTSVAWGDFNGDGDLDLFVAHYVDWSPQNHPLCQTADRREREVCTPRFFEGLPNVLYLSRGDGTFGDATEVAKVGQPGKSLGAIAADVDLDGDVDLYVGNDTVENFLYVNDGRGRFDEIGQRAGVAAGDLGVPDGSMGVDVCDFNNDGRPDIWTANYEREAFALYRNEGKGQFLHISQAAGITALGGLFVGWGTAFADLDGDGDEDIVVACGHLIKHPLSAPRRQAQLVLENTSGRFRRVAFPTGHYFQKSWEARGLAAGDWDNDGDIDLAIAHVNEPSAVIVNQTPPLGRWCGVRLVGRHSNRDAIGAYALLETSQGQQLRLVKGGGSYQSQTDYRLFWGIPHDAQVVALTIVWPSGIRQSLTPELLTWQTIVEPQ